MESNLQLWLIPTVPLLGALWNGLWGKRSSERAVASVAVGAVAVSFLLALRAFFALGDAPYLESYFSWIAAASFQAHFNFYLDPLSAVMALIVTGVGLLIHIYAVGYMSQEGGYYRFFCYMNLFLFFMLTLVLAGNYLLMFVGWEGVGLCSYLLIGFYFRREDAADAGKKAFITTRLGDFGFLIALLMIYSTFESLNYSEVLPAAASLPVESTAGPLTVICLLLLVGAAGKSAQVPLYVWLPDAMLGPTPVSALIHAATMVTAGVYIIARSSALYVHAPQALFMVALVGGITAFYAATIGIVQTDIKRILAYSTISQIGYMVMACGVAAFSAAIFHLMTHAFFKALLFLGAGSVIHALGGEQDIRKMGGLRHYLPRTYWSFLIACLAIAALPPFSGFFSKDPILWEAYVSPYGGILFWLLGILTAGITSFYIFRLFFLTFHGHSKTAVATSSGIHVAEPAHHGVPHESPPIMTWPLMILAALSLAGGWVGIPALWRGGDHWNLFLAPAFRLAALPTEHAVSHDAATEIIFTLASILVSVAGIALAYLLYCRRPELAAAAAARLRGLHTLVLNKYYVDEIYRSLFVQPLVVVSRELLWKGMDAAAIDGSFQGLANRTRRLGDRVRRMQSGNIRSYAGWVVLGAILLISFMVGLAS
ncbi:MAG: NADH-quinone oxidoreductase subunit L [Acidobacteria bacterium]|nr:NADH-quinone oxidoreductase subunit L [Acidobacteriota bacterium]